jgi:hypothetical protein
MIYEPLTHWPYFLGRRGTARLPRIDAKEIRVVMNGNSPSANIEHVATLVARLIDAGCDICAIGRGYAINEPEDAEGSRRVDLILKDFGPRDHLTGAISAHLRAFGRFVEIE